MKNLESPNVLVVIPCLNEVNHIDSLVDKFSSFLLQHPSSKLVFADGGSTDGTIDKILAHAGEQIIFLDNPKKIQSAAVNLAVKVYSDGFEYLVRVDAHGDYPDDYIESLIDDAVGYSADSVVVPMKTVGKKGFQKIAASAQNSKLGNGGSAHRSANNEGRWIEHGHHALMRVDAFKSVGGYDETFVANEDAELDNRLTKAGYRIWITANTYMVYYPRTNAKSLFIQYFRYGVGRACNCLKHKKVPKIRQLIPLSVAPCLLLALAAPIHWVFALPCILWLVACSLVGALEGLKSRSLLELFSGVGAMVMHMGWSFGFLKGLYLYSVQPAVEETSNFFSEEEPSSLANNQK